MKKNILILVTKLSNGGAERAAVILAENLSKQYNVKLCVFDASHRDYDTDVEVIDMKTPNSENVFLKVIHLFKRILKLKKIKKENEIDCTISFLTGPNFVNVFSKTNGKIKEDKCQTITGNISKTIISIRNNIEAKGKLESYITNFLLTRADKVVTVAEKMRDYYIKSGNISPDKIVTIYNVCQIDKIKQLANEPIEKYEDIFKDQKVILSIGRMIDQKGQWHLINAFNEFLKRRQPNNQYKEIDNKNLATNDIFKKAYNQHEEQAEYKLVIFGRGNKKKHLEDLIHQYNLENKVFLLDFVHNPYQYMKNSAVFIMPSLYEGCSNALLEALAVGIPIIASDCDYGNREILAPNLKEENLISNYRFEEYGILVPVGESLHYMENKNKNIGSQNTKSRNLESINKRIDNEQNQKSKNAENLFQNALTEDERQLCFALEKLLEDEQMMEMYREKSAKRIEYFTDNTEEWIKCIEEE